VNSAALPSAPVAPAGRVAYLVNQYPKPNHSFIRREIQALERLGWTVERFATRGWSDALQDPQDLAERERTAYLLRGGADTLLDCLAAPVEQLQAMGACGRDRVLMRHDVDVEVAGLTPLFLASLTSSPRQ
jgi:hypothetical protein